MEKREIKFRHYFPSTKVMTAGHHPHTIIITSSGKEDFWKDAIWLEYTGLKDSSGKEIYEGDIWEQGHYPKSKIVVEFERGKFNVADYLTNKGKVLGNIYQNPEILL